MTKLVVINYMLLFKNVCILEKNDLLLSKIIFVGCLLYKLFLNSNLLSFKNGNLLLNTYVMVLL